MLQVIRSKALANAAISTTDSDYPSTSASSPKGPLPVPERWAEEAAKGPFQLEDTDPTSTDQEVGSTSSADNAAAADPDAEETGSVDEESVALEHDEETSIGSQDEQTAASTHDEDEASTAPGSGLMMSSGLTNA